jgi:hypothetical protein
MARKRFSHLPGSPVGSPILTETSMKRSTADGGTAWKRCAHLESRFGENDVGTTGKRAIDETDSMGGEQVLGSRADRGFDLSLRVCVEFGAAEHVARYHRDIAGAEGVGAHVEIGVGQGFQ